MGFTAVLAVILPSILFAETAKEEAEGRAFPLKEISAFNLQEFPDFKGGEYVELLEKPIEDAKAWPKFASLKPLYGAVRFGAMSGIKNSGLLYLLAVDETTGLLGKHYVLYFDLNRDGDLTNDPPLNTMMFHPDGAVLGYQYIKKEIFFDYIKLEFDLGEGKKRICEILPRLLVQENNVKILTLVSTKLRTGEVEIAGKKYSMYLGHSYAIGPGFDWRGTTLHIVSRDNPGWRPFWWGADTLRAIHYFGGPSGGYYRFSTTPLGDQLIVKPYTGDFGTFEIGVGDRKIDKMEVQGSLDSPNIAVAVGKKPDALAGNQTPPPVGAGMPPQPGEWGGNPIPARSCPVPVGDYLPSYITVSYGFLSIDISQNYHSDGKSNEREGRPNIYGIAIRKDKPFVLDFTNKPEVMFTSPPKGHSVKRGGNLRVAAVLTDPVLDIMIRGLDDTTRKMKRSYGETDLSLDPTVTITRGDGEIVAQGVMPFG